MSLAKVKWRLQDEEFEVIGHGRLWLGERDAIAGSVDVVKAAGLTELNRALDRYRATMYDGDLELLLYESSEEELRNEEEDLNPRPISLEFGGGHTFVVVQAAFEPSFRVDEAELAALLYPQLRRHRATLMPVHEDVTGSATFVRLTFEISPRGRSVNDAIQIGDDLERLWMATLGGDLSAETLYDLLQAGRSDLMVGQPETGWLECKGRSYRLSESREEFELAKDVAMLANQTRGGVLLIGPATRKKDGLDVIKKVIPQALSDIRPTSYEGAIKRTVFPPPQDLTIEVITMGADTGILFIEIPPQPQALLPFLVVGAIAGEKVLGNHFSLVYRRGDRGVALRPEEVHGLLIAGRAALNTGGPGAGAESERGRSEEKNST